MAVSSTTTAVARAKACLAKAVPVLGWPFIAMAKVALLDSQSDFDLLQKAIDYLTCKAKAKMAFTKEEREFLEDFYLAMREEYMRGVRCSKK